MINFTIWLVFLGTVLSVKSMNPIKVSAAILATSMILFLLMNLKSSSSWIPCILMMLFMGGIILMFVILSSVMPNEMLKKSKKHSLMICLFFLTSTILPINLQYTITMVNELKSFLSSGLSFFIIASLITTYFIGAMSILSAEKVPMRDIHGCYNNFNFVN